MPITTPRHRFIPLARRDVYNLCLADGVDDPYRFDDLCRLLTAVIHFQHHARLEALKEAYAPFDPSRDTRPLRELSAEERRAAQARFAAELRLLLEDANFEEVTDADLDIALDSESLLEVRLHVDFDDFDEVAFFRRGGEVREATVKSLGGLRKRTIQFLNYDRVVMYVKLREREHFEAAGRDDVPFEPGSTILKLFQNVPRPDLEMLFPNTEVRMRPIDKVLIGVPAVIGGIVVVATRLLASIGVLVVLLGVWLGVSDSEAEIDQAELVALGVGIGSVGGFLFKQVTKFKNRKIRFMKTLADNLYFKNLDNDAGVFHNLVDAAEEEESKEAILAYWWLLTRGPRDVASLDRELEAWLAGHAGHPLDFDVTDAVADLAELGIVEVEGDLRRALPIGDALEVLDRRWDDAFVHPVAGGAHRRE